MNKRMLFSFVVLSIAPALVIATLVVSLIAMLHTANPSRWRYAAPLASLRDGEPMQPPFADDAAPIYVVKHGDEVIAFNRYTPFASRCTFTWHEAARKFHDPCGGANFDARGRWLDGPADREPDRHPVKVEDGWVIVDVGTIIPGRNFWQNFTRR